MACSRNSAVNYFGFLYLVGGSIQFVFSCAALGTPHFFVGEFTLETVEGFANSINTLTFNESLGTLVHAEIGIFQTVINGVVFNENREGFKPMLGFLIVSIVHAFQSIVTSIPLIYPNWRQLFCCKKYNKNFSKVTLKNKGKSEKSHAQKNFASCLNTFVVLALFYFTAQENFRLVDLGFSFYILLVVGIWSFVQGVISWEHSKHYKSLYDKQKNKSTMKVEEVQS